jgi:hypothetical protein
VAAHDYAFVLVVRRQSESAEKFPAGDGIGHRQRNMLQGTNRHEFPPGSQGCAHAGRATPADDYESAT